VTRIRKGLISIAPSSPASGGSSRNERERERERERGREGEGEQRLPRVFAFSQRKIIGNSQYAAFHRDNCDYLASVSSLGNYREREPRSRFPERKRRERSGMRVISLSLSLSLSLSCDLSISLLLRFPTISTLPTSRTFGGHPPTILWLCTHGQRDHF